MDASRASGSVKDDVVNPEARDCITPEPRCPALRAFEGTVIEWRCISFILISCIGWLMTFIIRGIDDDVFYILQFRVKLKHTRKFYICSGRFV